MSLPGSKLQTPAAHTLEGQDPGYSWLPMSATCKMPVVQSENKNTLDQHLVLWANPTGFKHCEANFLQVCRLSNSIGGKSYKTCLKLGRAHSSPTSCENSSDAISDNLTIPCRGK